MQATQEFKTSDPEQIFESLLQGKVALQIRERELALQFNLELVPIVIEGLREVIDRNFQVSADDLKMHIAFEVTPDTAIHFTLRAWLEGVDRKSDSVERRGQVTIKLAEIVESWGPMVHVRNSVGFNTEDYTWELTGVYFNSDLLKLRE